MNILVTGSNGQLGNHVRLLSDGSQHCYFFTDVDALDITRRDAVMNFVLTNGINVVVNCAAYTNVDRAEEEEALADLVNNDLLYRSDGGYVVYDRLFGIWLRGTAK